MARKIGRTERGDDLCGRELCRIVVMGFREGYF